MEELVWVAGAGLIALVPPLRRRVVPVSRALLSAGLTTATAALRGLEGVAVAAVRGDAPGPGGATPADAAPASPAAPTPSPRKRSRVATGPR
jgi:hypothetical protein